MKGLTTRQQQVLNAIRSYIKEHRFPPTIRELSETFSISVKGAYDHVKALEKKGYISCDTNRSRAIEILDEEPETSYGVEVPILGTVAAGAPLFAEENYEGSVRLPDEYIGSGRYFALRVRGESMVGAGIMNGDTAVIRHQETANNGDIVVAMVDDAVTLKRFYKEKNRIKLKAENPDFPDIYSCEVRVLGKLKHIIRKYE